MIEWLILIFVVIGLIFNFLGVFGLIRFPDVYTRLHAATKCTTFGTIFLTLAVAGYAFGQWFYGNMGMGNMGVHALFALLALLFTNPTGAHAIARAAHKSGVEPAQAVIDQLKEDEEEKRRGPTASEEEVPEEIEESEEKVEEETEEGGEDNADKTEEEPEAKEDGEEKEGVEEAWGEEGEVKE